MHTFNVKQPIDHLHNFFAWARGGAFFASRLDSSTDDGVLLLVVDRVVVILLSISWRVKRYV